VTVTNLQPSWPATVNTWTYPQNLPVGLNLDGLEQDVIEAGFSLSRPDHYQGLDIPVGERIATIDEWTFQVTVNSFATKAFLFIQGESTWVVTTDGPGVSDDGSGNFGIGTTSMTPPTGPGLPLGTTTITVTPTGSDEPNLANYGGFPGLYGYARWHFTAGGSNSTFTVPDGAEFVFESLDVTYTTEVDPAQQVWHAIVAGDGFVAGGGGHTIDLADPGSIPQPIPCDIDTPEAIRWVSIDIDVGNAGEITVRQDSTVFGGSLIFEDTPDEADAISQASSPVFDVGVDGSATFVGAVAQRFHWFSRYPQEVANRILLELSPGLAVTSLDIWYERILEPPVALFFAIPTSGPAALHVDVDATASYDPTTVCYPLLGIVSYEWDYDYDGFTFIPQPPSGVLSSHLYTTPGVYVIALRVTDGDGQTDMAFETITVGESESRWKVGQIGLGVPS
jgi:hypothetical protein